MIDIREVVVRGNDPQVGRVRAERFASLRDALGAQYVRLAEQSDVPAIITP